LERVRRSRRPSHVVVGGGVDQSSDFLKCERSYGPRHVEDGGGDALQGLSSFQEDRSSPIQFERFGAREGRRLTPSGPSRGVRTVLTEPFGALPRECLFIHLCRAGLGFRCALASRCRASVVSPSSPIAAGDVPLISDGAEGTLTELKEPYRTLPRKCLFVIRSWKSS
jgi:hypothetical protein